jgi:hypothetical protein
MLIKFPVTGRKETQFWVRAFQLEKEIEKVLAIMNEDVRRKTGFCPMIYDYQAGEKFFCMLIGATLDSLGVIEGMGLIWITSGEEHKQAALKERDKFAKDLFKEAEQKSFDEVLEIDSGREV